MYSKSSNWYTIVYSLEGREKYRLIIRERVETVYRNR